MNILDAIQDRRLIKPFLQGNAPNLRTWQNWLVETSLSYGLSVKPRYEGLVLKCTGRPLDSFQADGLGATVILILSGRRSGKSRNSAVKGAWEACLSGKWELLAPGEMGMVVIICPTKKQGRIIRNYLRAIFSGSPLLEDEVINETQEGFALRNGITIEIMVGDYRTIRGYTLLAAIVDEVCFFGLDAESKVRNDSELIQALMPALATVNGRLICISSKYAKRGWAYRTWKKHWGNPDSKILVWDSDSRTMNPTLSQEIIDAAYAEDAVSARSEYGGMWREDISQWLPLETIESAVIKGRKGLMGRRGISYSFFADISGGRVEDSCLAIGHQDKESKKVILDMLYVYQAPNSPNEVILDMCSKIKRFSGQRVVADNYSANFVSDAFKANHINFSKCELPKSKLYLELIGNICSGQVEILDHKVLIQQLCSLERRTRSGGKDSVDHPAGQKDDCANCLAGMVWILQGGRRKRAGVFLQSDSRLEEMKDAVNISAMY